MRAASLIGALVVALGGCSITGNGPSQSIPVATVPPGADCALSRGGVLLARIKPTPGIVTLAPSSEPLTFTCGKPGYRTTTYVNEPIPREASFAERIAINLGQADAGSLMLYHSPVTITLAPMPAPKPKKPAKIPYGAVQPAPEPVPTPRVESAPLSGSR